MKKIQVMSLAVVIACFVGCGSGAAALRSKLAARPAIGVVYHKGTVELDNGFCQGPGSVGGQKPSRSLSKKFQELGPVVAEHLKTEFPDHDIQFYPPTMKKISVPTVVMEGLLPKASTIVVEVPDNSHVKTPLVAQIIVSGRFACNRDASDQAAYRQELDGLLVFFDQENRDIISRFALGSVSRENVHKSYESNITTLIQASPPENLFADLKEQVPGNVGKLAQEVKSAQE